MRETPVFVLEAARKDVERAFDDYLDEAGSAVALSFTEDLEAGLAHVARHPASGSPRYAVELDLPGLRYWPLARFPFLIFYARIGVAVEVWRVLHAHRDIAASLRPRSAPGPDEVREQLADYRVAAPEVRHAETQ